MDIGTKRGGYKTFDNSSEWIGKSAVPGMD